MPLKQDDFQQVAHCKQQGNINPPGSSHIQLTSIMHSAGKIRAMNCRGRH